MADYSLSLSVGVISLTESKLSDWSTLSSILYLSDNDATANLAYGRVFGASDATTYSCYGDALLAYDRRFVCEPKNFTLTTNSTQFNRSYIVSTVTKSYTLSSTDVELFTGIALTIQQDIQSLSPGAIVEMFVLDTTSLGGSIYRFHAGTNELRNAVVWQGNTYTPFPIEASGFEMSSQGQLPRPMLKVANITGVVGALVNSLDDLIGCKITRKRTMVHYLDAVNFTGSVNHTADPNQYYPDEVWFVNRKSSENKVFIEFELASALDVQGVKLPRRQVIQNTCTWRYRSTECSYAGGAVADINDNATTDLNLDNCSRRKRGCQLRFGDFATLPFGAFPGAGLSQ